MRILAIEIEKPNASPEDFKPLLEEEAKTVWKLHQEDIIREVYFRGDKTNAVLMLECVDVEDARAKLSQLPLVSAGLISFDLIPLVPYPGYERLFTRKNANE